MTTDAELVEKMALAAWQSEGYTKEQWEQADYQEKSSYIGYALAALAVARPIIEREALERRRRKMTEAKDDIETLREFITGICTDKGRREARPKALAALERLEKERADFLQMVNELDAVYGVLGTADAEGGDPAAHTIDCLLTERDSLRTKLAEVEARNRDGEETEYALRSDVDERNGWIEDAERENAFLRAKLGKAMGALKKIELKTGATFSLSLSNEVIGDVHSVARDSLAARIAELEEVQMFLTAKKVPYSSIVGQSITLHDEKGAHVGQLSLHSLRPPEGMSLKDFADDIADLICLSFEDERAKGGGDENA